MCVEGMSLAADVRENGQGEGGRREREGREGF